MNILTELGKILNEINNYRDDQLLFLPKNESWNVDSKGVVLCENDIDGLNFAKLHKLENVIGIYAVQDIVANLKQQIPDPSPDQLTQAFLFYYDNDAFIEI